MLQLFNKVNSGIPIEFITINGDMSAHGFSLLEDATPEEQAVKYPQLMKIHTILQEMFTAAFPTTPIVYTFGNNDNKYHNQPTFDSDKKAFYDYMFHLWFEKHTPNQKWAAAAEKTFKSGGYFRADINDKLTVLSFNTLYYTVMYDT